MFELPEPRSEIRCPACQKLIPPQEIMNVVPVPVEELMEVVPVAQTELSPLRHTTIVRYSLIRALFISTAAILFGIGFLALAIYFLPNCGGWIILILSIVFLLGGGLEGRNVFKRGPILIIEERGFTDTRTEDRAALFLPWNEIVGATSFRVRVNLLTASDTLTIHCQRPTGGGRTAVKVDTQGLTMSGASVANLIKQHLRALGR
jgi:hypothetical protein